MTNNSFTDDKLPLVHADLVNELDRRFPHKCPDLSMNEKEIWFAYGQRSVVDFLADHLKQQTETIFDMEAK